MSRHHSAPTSMRVLLIVSLLLAFVGIEQRATPPVAQAATPVSISAGRYHTCGVKSNATLACWGLNDDGQASPPAGSFAQVSAGFHHTCGVKSDSTLACWGWNDDGQASPPAGSFTQVSAGFLHTCGVKSDGTLACWGDNDNGQATPPAGSFSQVSAGTFHTCGLKSDGSLACWGYNIYRQATPPAGTFTQVSAGGYHSCGLKSDGSLACWGAGTTNTAAWPHFGQASPPAGSFTQISAGGSHTCGVQSDGSLACWGYNLYEQATPPAGSFTQVSAGESHTCGVRSDGTAVCWGAGVTATDTPPHYGQTRSGVSISSPSLPTVKAGSVPPALSGAGGIGGPYTFTVVGGTLPTGLTLNSDGTWTWGTLAGRGDYSFDVKVVDAGILGAVQHLTLHVVNTSTAITGDTPDPSTVGQPAMLQYAVTPLNAGTPTGTVTVAVVQQALRFLQVSAGIEHTCGLKGDGTLACWGKNNSGQATPPAGSFTLVSAGAEHTCGLKRDGTVACWGANTYGQATPPVGSFSQVSAGGGHTCGLKRDGTVACWGANTYGQATPPSGSFTQVSAGYAHTCGLKSDGTVACWGNNDYGQTTPPEGSFSQVSAGYAHSCGVKNDSTLVCWGNNDYGQTTPPSDSFSQVSAGIEFTCAVQSDGTVACWGKNNYGQITSPGGNFTQVSAGGGHTCAVKKSDGTAVCWGANFDEQAMPPPPATITNSAESCTASVSAGGCAVPFSSVGLKYLRASYAGDGAFDESVSALIAHSVKAATTTTIASITPGPASAGSTVLVRYTVASAVQELPGGVVTVRAGADTCTGPATAGVCRLTFTSAGVKSITATYAGDIAFFGSVSAAAAHTAKNATTTTITSTTLDPAGAERTVLVRYTVADAVQGIPGGAVTVRAGAASCTASVAAGECRLTFTSAGEKSLTATYAGDSAFYGSVSAAVAYTVADKVLVFLPLVRR